MGKRTIYLISSANAYEECVNLYCYSDKEQADYFKECCEKHQKLRPECPEIDDSDETWNKYHEAEEEWERNHPAGEDHASEYFIEAIELIT